MIEKILKSLNAIIPFIAPYPVWVKVLLGVWILLTAVLVVTLIFASRPKPENTESLPKGTDATVQHADPPASQGLRHVTRDPNTHRTQIYPRTKALVDQRRKHLINEKVDPWLMIHTGKMRPIKLHDGRTCQYTGDAISYDGSPALVFWEALIDPFLEDEIRHVLDSVGNECVENKIDAEIPLDEAAMLLRGMVQSVYDRMVYVDQRLCSKPSGKEKAPRRDVHHEVDKMVKYVDEQETAAKALFSRKAK